MGLITIDESKCQRCGFCIMACPVGIIAQGEGFPASGYPTTIEKIEKGCITCGHCVAACPNGALSHCRMPIAECTPLSTDWRLTPEQVAYRCNLVTVSPDGTMVDFTGGHPSSEDAAKVIEALDDELGGEVEFHPGVQYRHSLIAPASWA
ncbi:MAG TPA: 4Fe-4S binding protein, partial [Geobacteraceae bacterium]|nr:4Fe-4S binding protein [Geobacteraceae bacterium]